MKKLSPAAIKVAADAIGILEDEIEKAQDYFDRRPETWRDSDEGTDYQAWIEALQAVVDALNDLPEEPE